MGRASDSTSHGGFDNDPITMNSVLRRVTGRISGEAIEPFTTASAGRSPDIAADDLAYLPEALAEAVRSFPMPGAAPGPAPAAERPAQAASANGGRSGAKRALCIGIDRYRAISPLGGCVNDAEAWRGALEGFGFEARRMPEEDATAEGIRDRVGQFVSEARSGDTFVIHYSGHGTQFQDATGDEPDGQDEAICAIDCGVDGATGLVLDDEFRDILGGVDSGTTLICFFDSCHSGSVTRLRLDRRMRAARGSGPSARVARRIAPTPAMKQAYAALIARDPKRRDLQQPMREVVFSACQPNQLAYESDGQGDFTRHALQVLKVGGARPSNSGFMNKVLLSFRGSAVQLPLLDCDPGALETPFTFGSWA